MGYSTRQIVAHLNRHHSTIARELNRKTQITYQAELADELARQRRLVCRCLEKKSEEVIETIHHYLKLTLSPQQISNIVLKNVLSFKTIYRWIYDGTILLGDLSCLRQKGKRRKLRETHFYVAVKIENRSASEIYRAIHELYKYFPKDIFKTYTVDQGKEFACYSKVEADLKVPIYFAHAYSSWEIGSNENANGLLREFFPKKTDLTRVSGKEINEALCLINHRPRKCLGWKTAWITYTRSGIPLW